jgi:hypothetical protein
MRVPFYLSVPFLLATASCEKGPGRESAVEVSSTAFEIPRLCVEPLNSPPTSGVSSRSIRAGTSTEGPGFLQHGDARVSVVCELILENVETGREERVFISHQRHVNTSGQSLSAGGGAFRVAINQDGRLTTATIDGSGVTLETDSGVRREFHPQ